MRKICLVIFGLVFFAACDLQPKITSIPDTVGDFISSRYPALLADPNTESDIYNSAARDYGVYASPELYGSVDMGDYVNYAGVDDYSLPEDTPDSIKEVADNTPAEDAEKLEPATKEAENVSEEDASDETESEEETDVLDIPEYKTDEINVPARAAVGTVIVHRGDTLYAIAREHNMTLEEIAKENNISAPYTIRTGQVLKIKSAAPVKADVKEPVPEAAKPVVKETPKPESKASAKVEEKKAEPKVTKQESKPETKPETKPVPKSESKPEPKVQKDIRVPVKDIQVARGDTLYSISRQYSVPVNDLAVMNGMSAPFTLSVGQTLHVPDLPTRKVEPVKPATPSAKAGDKKAETKSASDKKPATTKTDNKTVQKEPVKKAEPKKIETKKSDTKKPEQKKQETKQPTKKTETKTEKPAQKSTPKNEKIAARSSSKFSWPVRGTILSHYGAKTGGLYNDGINISATLNTTVVAAENGVVAYAGNEVRGMGNLIIIQHADGWMTVYAHMNSMNVRRGARVTVGQKIGAVGKTGKVTTPQLHFEIRKGTKAYNPINYLKK